MAKARILVVEDEGLVALQIKEGLVSAGFEVPAVASTGQEALKFARETEPDLVLMDIHLKGAMDGIQTADRIKEMFDIPVIYLTAYSDDHTIDRAKQTEPYGYILKPVTEKSLQLSIEMTLQKAAKERELKSNVNWYSSIIEGIGKGVIVIDIRGTVKFLNKCAEDLTRWKSGEITGKNYHEIFKLMRTGSKECVTITFDEVLLENKSENLQSALLCAKDNAEIPIQYSLLPLMNQNKTTIGIIIVFSYDDSETLPVQHETEPGKKEMEKKAAGTATANFPGKGERIENIRVFWFHKPGACPRGGSFDVFRLDNEHVGFYIFDVSWFDLTSALFALNFKRFLSPDSGKGGMLLSSGNEPGKPLPPLAVLKELNKRFFFEGEGNPFFTIVYGVTEIRTGKTRIARAGHPYPVYLQNSGKLILIKSDGGALGMFSEIDAKEYEFVFEPGSRLYLYSEGLIDSNYADMNEGSFSRLIQFIEETKKQPLKDQVNELETTEKKWHEHLQVLDEIFFVVLERE